MFILISFIHLSNTFLRVYSFDKTNLRYIEYTDKKKMEQTTTNSFLFSQQGKQSFKLSDEIIG